MKRKTKTKNRKPVWWVERGGDMRRVGKRGDTYDQKKKKKSNKILKK